MCRSKSSGGWPASGASRSPEKILTSTVHGHAATQARASRHLAGPKPGPAAPLCSASNCSARGRLASLCVRLKAARSRPRSFGARFCLCGSAHVVATCRRASMQFGPISRASPTPRDDAAGRTRTISSPRLSTVETPGARAARRGSLGAALRAVCRPLIQSELPYS